MAQIREVEIINAAPLQAYQQFSVPGNGLDELHQTGHQVGNALRNHRVWMLNSTATGGGVAEMMPQLCALLNQVGVDTRWIVLDPERPEFFRATKAIHNMIHGADGGLSLKEIASIYEEVSRDAARALRAIISHEDILVVHDPQPLGLESFISRQFQPRSIWRCHIGAAHANEHTRAAWTFLAPYLDTYEKLLFSAEFYIPDMFAKRSGVLRPTIDPLSHKNRELHPYKHIGVLRSAGLAEGPSQRPWAQFHAKAKRFVEGRWEEKPIEDLLYSPIILQVSRFDRLKGFEYLIPAFEHLMRDFPERVARMKVNTERASCEMEITQLVLVGPDPTGVSDDPEATEVLEHLCEIHSALPPELRTRVHLVRLPMVSVRENALAVNALQRMASLIVQNSLQEGFGLTVTEAMWKATPVVASHVGGIPVQIRNAVDGFLIHDPTDVCGISDTMMRALAYRKQAENMGISGRERVREHFLVTTQVRRWLEEIQALLGMSVGPSAGVPVPALSVLSSSASKAVPLH
jgi:trehalose synthase